MSMILTLVADRTATSLEPGLIAAVTLEDTKRVAKRLFGDGELLVTYAGRPLDVA